MTTDAEAVVQRLWSYCHVLRDDGVSYGDYVEQLTYLLFLKLDDERVREGDASAIPPDYSWASLRDRDGAELAAHYRATLSALGRGGGLISLIFGKARNRIQDPAKLRHLIRLIDEERWSDLDIDLKAQVYEGLLAKNALDVKSGAGQYFTPRPLVRAIVDVMRPEPGMTLCDPAAGTGGFLVAAHDYVTRHHRLDRSQREHLDRQALHGWEIVEDTARLCVMNLYLHGGKSSIRIDDALVARPRDRFDMVLTNPPFGKKSSVTYVTDEGELRRESRAVVRDDFWASTSNKQLNFLQHVHSILKVRGRAAVVVPDNVLFEGGAGEVIRRRLLYECDVHTLLRLPTGIFYAPGVQANVLFFDRRPLGEGPGTTRLWVYDLRTDRHFTLKRHPLTRADLDDFVRCYNPIDRRDRRPTWSAANRRGRWRPFGYDALLARDRVNLNIRWLRDASAAALEDLAEPEILAAEMLRDLASALEQLRALVEDLEAYTG